MYIQSKLKESGTVVFNLHLEKAGKVLENEALLHEISIIEKGGDYVDIESLQLFTSGLGIIKTSFHVRRRITDMIKITGEHVQFLFFFHGKPHIVNDLLETQIILDEGFVHRSYQKNVQLTVEMCPDNEIKYIAILMSKDYFMNLLKGEPWSIKDSFFAEVAADRLVEIGSEGILMNFRVREILKDITKSDCKDEDRKYYIELKLKELIFELYTKQSRVPSGFGSLDRELYKKVNKARAILTRDFMAPPTIKQLAKMIALNELKLKQSFKLAYGVTIRSYIIVLRMKEAHSLLQEESALVNEVSVKVGYRSVPHFISTFKSYFGFTPKQLTKIAPKTTF